MSLLLLPELVLDSICELLQPADLCSLRAASFNLNTVCLHRILLKLYIYDDTQFTFPSSCISDYTLVPVSKIRKFHFFIENNSSFLDSINSIIIKATNNSNNNDLDSFLNFILNNEKLVNLKEYKNYNSDDNINIIKVANVLQENDQTNPCSRDINGGDNGCNDDDGYGYGDVDCCNNGNINGNPNYPLTPSPKTLKDYYNWLKYVESIKINHNSDLVKYEDLNNIKHLEFDDSFDKKSFDSLPFNILLNWSNNLKSLIFFKYYIFNSFVDSVLEFQKLFKINLDSINLFPNLEKLSIVLTDKLNSDHLNILNNINLSNIKYLEIKFKRIDIIDSNNFNLKLIEILNNKLNFNKLATISIVNLNNMNMLSNNIFQNEIFNDSNLCISLMKNLNLFNKDNSNLKFLNLNLNTFLTVVDIYNEGSTNFQNFIVSNEYIKIKQSLIKKIFKFNKLNKLIIPDFFFNWMPFLDNNFKFNKNGNNKFISLIKQSYWRFEDFELNSSLNPVSNYLIKKKKIQLVFNSKFNNDFYKLILPYFKDFINNLPNLNFINLGGIAATVDRELLDNDCVAVTLTGLYDDFVFTYCLNGNIETDPRN